MFWIPLLAGALVAGAAGVYTGVIGGGTTTYIETVVQEAAGYETWILAGGLIISLVVIGYVLLSKPRAKRSRR